MKQIAELMRLPTEELTARANTVRRRVYGTDLYIRGLIEISNHCQKNCLYCGIRAGNTKAVRYRLDKPAILRCCHDGYMMGFRTFVLQSGEDPALTDAWVCDVVTAIKQSHPDCAVSLSLGEKTKQSYQAYFDAGADRYLLRHETANPAHYAYLHPGQSSERRKQCLFDLKAIGYETGSGFLVGSPGQTEQHLLEDLHFLMELRPDMIGIGPFIPHDATAFADHPPGDIEACIRLIALLRLMLPHALIPATTALATLHPDGRLRGLKAGANVVMPNLSPDHARKQYSLYNHKLSHGAEGSEGLEGLKIIAAEAGCQIVVDIGSVKKASKEG